MLKTLIDLITVFTVGCSQSVNLQLAPQVNAYVHSNSQQAIPLTINDSTYKELNDWLSRNQQDWLTTSGRYPGGVYIKSNNHGIQVTPLKVIIYSSSAAETKALYIKHIGPEDLKLTKKLGQ